MQQLMGKMIKFDYTNWEGKFGTRKIIVCNFGWGSNKWHPEGQFLLSGYDLEKNAMRHFAMKDIENVEVI